jgi:hypothetical protein
VAARAPNLRSISMVLGRVDLYLSCCHSVSDVYYYLDKEPTKLTEVLEEAIFVCLKKLT